MEKEEIKKIWIDKSNKLCIQPKLLSFEMIYRSAMGVYWDIPGQYLYPLSVGSWSSSEWYDQIVSAVRDEYRYQLCITNNTQWENVNETIKQSIMICDNKI